MKVRVAAVGLVLLVVLAHGVGVWNGFVWDDDRYVTENPALRSFDGLTAIWGNPGTTPQYYPLTHTSFWLEYQAWGLWAPGYHGVNIGLQALAAILLFLVLKRLGVPGAWLAAAVFAVHPIQVESVAWVTERKNLLSGVFYLGSLFCWVRALGLDRDDREDAGGGTEIDPGLAIFGTLLFALGLLSKTVVASLPVTLLLLVWWKRRRFSGGLLFYTVTMLALGLMTASLTSWLEKYQVNALGEEWSLSFVERVMVAGRAWWFYLGKLVWPLDQVFIYPRWEIDGARLSALLWPALAAASLLTLWALRDRLGRGPLVAMLHYGVALSPALGFFNVYPMRYSWVADHFQYLAGVGPLVLLIALASRAPLPSTGPFRAARPLAAILLLSTLVTLSWQRTPAYLDQVTLWEDTLAGNPQAWIAHNNLGILYAERGREAEAEEHFRSVIELKPDHAGARSNLGLLLVRQGKPGEALPHLEAAIELDPENVNGSVVLGDARKLTGDNAGAEASYRQALRLDPTNPLASLGLGDLKLRARDFDAAVALLSVVVNAAPGNPDVRFKLATALAAQGSTEQALEQFQATLALRPDDADAHYNAGTLLARAGRLEQAERHLAAAVALRPDFREASNNLARVRELIAEGKR
jgi:Flp pilus assembly protein TadD